MQRLWEELGAQQSNATKKEMCEILLLKPEWKCNAQK